MVELIFATLMQAVQYAEENLVDITITRKGEVWVLKGKKKGE